MVLRGGSAGCTEPQSIQLFPPWAYTVSSVYPHFLPQVIVLVDNQCSGGHRDLQAVKVEASWISTACEGAELEPHLCIASLLSVASF